MTEQQSLPPLSPLPKDIGHQIRRLLQTPDRPELVDWLLQLIKNSGHLSTTDDMRWRVLSLVWLAQFDVEAAWPYLMWLNMNEPVMDDHLVEILVDAADDFDAHVQLAGWLKNPADERLKTFFSEFRPVPPAPKLPALFHRLLSQAAAPATGDWLALFCQNTAGDTPPHLRRWRLLAAVWYAANFDPGRGLAWLRDLNGGDSTLSAEDKELLFETAAEIDAVYILSRWMVDFADPALKTMLAGFGRPNLPNMAETMLQSEPDYSHLTGQADQAAADAAVFHRNLALLEESGLNLKTARILDVACGPLAPQTVLLTAAGCQVIGVDLQIPPAFLPLSGLKQWFKRRKHSQAWQAATQSYYQALGRAAGRKPALKKTKIRLGDPLHLDFADAHFEAVVCANYLHHTADPAGLLAEAARVLKPGGLLLADVRPYPAFGGAFTAAAEPWQHLRQPGFGDTLPLNQWAEDRYRTAVESHFTIDQWRTTQDDAALAALTPEIQTELARFSPEALTRKEIVILAKKQ